MVTEQSVFKVSIRFERVLRYSTDSTSTGIGTSTGTGGTYTH